MLAPVNISADAIDDGVVRIRVFTASDAAAVVEAVAESVPEITRHLPSLHERLTCDDVGRWIESTHKAWSDGSGFHSALVDAATDQLLGGANLFQFQWNHRLANLSYWVRRSAAGRGVATRATRLIGRFAFDRLKLNRVEIVIAASHPASQRVAEKAGAKFEGVLRNRIGFAGPPTDARLYSLIPGDLQRGE